MRNTSRLFLVAILCLFLPVIARAQLNQSGGGGSIVSITQGGNTASVSAGGSLKVNVGEINGVTPLMGNGVTGTGSLRVTIASDNSPIAVTTTLGAGSDIIGNVRIDQTTPGTTNKVSIGTDGTVALNAAIPAGTNVIGKVVKASTCGTTPFDSGLTEDVAITTGSDLASAATCVEALYITNTTGTPVDVTVKDKSGTPKDYMTTFSLPANSSITLPLWGMKFTGGVTVIAGTASALNAQLVGYQ